MINYPLQNIAPIALVKFTEEGLERSSIRRDAWIVRKSVVDVLIEPTGVTLDQQLARYAGQTAVMQFDNGLPQENA